jgi:hypothetical protein
MARCLAVMSEERRSRYHSRLERRRMEERCVKEVMQHLAPEWADCH